MYKKISIKNKIYFKPIILFFLFIFLCLTLFKNINNFISLKLKENNFSFNSIAPINIQIISQIKNSNYTNYIQNIYVKPNEDNKLMVLIKPNNWLFIKQDEKKLLLSKINEIWEKIYLEKNPKPLKKPQTFFSNSK